MRHFVTVLIVSILLATLSSGIFFLVAWLDGYGDLKLLAYLWLVFFTVFTAFITALAFYAKLRKKSISISYLVFLLCVTFSSFAVFFVINYLIKNLLPGVRQPSFYSFPRNLSLIFGILAFLWISRLKRRRYQRLIVAATVFLIVIWTIHSTIGIRFSGAGRTLHQRPNILLLTVESLRYDHLGCNGNTSVLTPCIDDLSKNGRTFDNYFIHVPYTTASLSSLLTGNYPFRHGARAFGQKPYPHFKHFIEEIARNRYVVRTDGSYFPQLFPQSSKWDTRARSLLDKVQAKLASVVYVLNDQLGNFLPGLFGGYCYGGNTAMRETSELLRNIRLHKNRTWFFWTHFIENCHWPYETPPQFATIYQKKRLSRQTVAHLRNLGYLNENPSVISDELLLEIQAAYSAEVTCMDRQIGYLIHQLKRLGLLENTVVILTTDHGELLGENQFFGHGNFLRDQLIHVPLLIYSPGHPFFSGGHRTSELVEEVDIAPTILDLCGIDPPETMDGRSISALWKGGIWQKDSIYCEVVAKDADFFAGLRSNRLKLIWDAQADKRFLLDLANDPDERLDISQDMPKELDKMERDLLSLTGCSSLKDLKPVPFQQIDEKMKEQMRTLGYIR